MGEATERSPEIEDFDPSTGHRHDCRPTDTVEKYIRASGVECDCAAQLYGIAATRFEMSDVIEKIGPVTGEQILVLHDVHGGDEPFGEQLIREMIEHARARGLTGEVAEHVPLVLILHGDASIETLDEKEMNEYGWFRAGTTIHRQGSTVVLPPGAYS